MRVLFFGDMSATGFGSVTMDLGGRLLTRGIDVRFVSQNDLADRLPDPFHNRTLAMKSLINDVNALTGQQGVTGAHDVMRAIIAGDTTAELTNGEPWGAWRPEAAIILGDYGAARYFVAHSPALAEIPSFHYVPVEGVSLPPTLATDLWATTRPVAVSEFGADEIAKVTGTRPPVVYHGVDTRTFYPVKPSQPINITADNTKPTRLTSKSECKVLWAAWFGVKVPRRWMLRTDRHMPRKRYNSMLRGLAPVLHAHPDTMLVIHCGHTDQGGSLPDSVMKIPGARLLEREQGSTDSDLPQPEPYALFGRDFPQIILTNLNGITRPMLASLYNAADLYVSTSAEGFGLTIAEALACGVPAVGLDYSAVPEVIGPAGKVVPWAYLFDNEYDHLWAVVDEQRFAETVHALLSNPAEMETLGRKGPRHVRSKFSWDLAANQFAELLVKSRSIAEVAA